MEALAYNYAYAAYEEAAGIEYDLPEWELNWKPPSSAWIGLLAAVAAISIVSTTGAAFAISAGRYYVSGNGLNVRKSPNGAYLYTRGYGQPVDLTGRTDRSGLWAQTVPGNWVYASLLTGYGGGNNSGGFTGGSVLGRGSQGSAVYAVQQALRNRGYYVSRDGVYGPQTESAVLQFQRNNGLLRDGKVGPQTRSYLL